MSQGGYQKEINELNALLDKWENKDSDGYVDHQSHD